MRRKLILDSRGLSRPAVPRAGGQYKTGKGAHAQRFNSTRKCAIATAVTRFGSWASFDAPMNDPMKPNQATKSTGSFPHSLERTSNINQESVQRPTTMNPAQPIYAPYGADRQLDANERSPGLTDTGLNMLDPVNKAFLCPPRSC